MKSGTGVAKGLRFFDRRRAVRVDDTMMMTPPLLDEAAVEALPEFRSGRGSVTKLLHGDPEGPDGGGPSLVWVRFGANYPLPRHSHSVDCVYYVIAGSLTMGSRTLGPGEGFFVGADAPYGYTAGPDGVELLEFRTVSHFESQIRESAGGWSRILAGVRANRDRWAEESPTWD